MSSAQRQGKIQEARDEQIAAANERKAAGCALITYGPGAISKTVLKRMNLV